MRLPRAPYVRRWRYDALAATLERALDDSTSLSAEANREAARWADRLRSAEARADAADTRTMRVFEEARKALSDAAALQKAAAAVLFSVPDDGERPESPSVGEADRLAGERIREQQAQRRR